MNAIRWTVLVVCPFLACLVLLGLPVVEAVR